MMSAARSPRAPHRAPWPPVKHSQDRLSLGRLSLAVVAMAGAAVVGAAEVRADEIILTDGTTITCEGIKEATAARVVFKVGASNQERRAEEVERIIPTDNSSFDIAMRLLRDNGDAGRIETNLKRVLDRGDAALKPFAQYFLGEHYERQGNTDEAVKAYEAVARLQKDHFYAAVGVYKVAELLLAQNQAPQAQQRLTRLASGEFGQAWKDKGGYVQARLQLKAGQRDQARQSFSRLAGGAATPNIRHLASCGEAACDLLANQAEPARRKFSTVAAARDAGPDAKGWAWKGLGDCQKTSAPDEALLAYLRSFLLYPSNPEARAAAAGAAEVSQAQKVGAEQRLAAISRSPMSWGDFSGPQPQAELMRRSLQFVSAALVRHLAPGLAAKATGEEKAELEFLAADAMKVVAQSANDPNLLKEYEDLLKELQKKYPNHGRAALAGIDGFQAAKDRALALIAQANEEGDPARKRDLLAQGRKLFADNMEPFKRTIAELTKEVDALTEKEARGELPEAEQEAKQEAEFRRDLAEFLLAEAYASFAQTYAEGDAGRKENLEHALKGYDHQINMRGLFPNLLYYSYVGRLEVQLELGQDEEAARNAEELSYIEPPFVPQDPQQRKAILDLTRDVCIRAFNGWVKALVKQGKFEDAMSAAAQIDDRQYAQGWEDHPLGILFIFERAKAMAGAGQGAQAAQDLWGIVEKSMKVPEAEKIAALGMSRIGAGACRALSELSDVSGGEIYAPEIQYHVGVGYFLRQRPELAIAGFKGVLVAARTPQERREWVPKAVRQIGNLFFQQERYLEAALAYETVMTEFPDHEDGPDAIKFSLSAAKRAVEQFGDDPSNSASPLTKLYKRIERGAAENDLEAAVTIFMREAADLQTREQWVAAAEKYLAVPAEIENEGKKRAVSFYPNAVANAGYCYFQAFKKNKNNQEHLTKARESLSRAVELARAAKDLEAQSLAAFYLGELECDLERPSEALAALAPFDRELAATSRYIVRARYQQAQAYMMQNQAGALEKAEEAYRKVADKRSDPVLPRFAYYMARTVRQGAVDALKAPGDQMVRARTLRERAGRYAKDFFDTSDKDTLREAHYFWIGGVVFDGGLYAEAAALYRDAFGRFQRPAVDAGDREAARTQSSWDGAEQNLGYALVLAGQHREGYDLLGRLRDTVDIKDRDDRLVGRGVFKKRELLGPYTVTFQGRKVSQKVWFTVLDVGGEEVKFFDIAQPGGADTQFQAVQGTDPTRSWGPGDQRTLTLSLKREYLVVDGLARAGWGLYEASRDKGFLAGELSTAVNELRYVLRGMSETYYSALVGGSMLEPTDYNVRLWDADVQFLRLKMAREEWREVVSDIKQMELLGKLEQAPAAAKEQIMAIKREAEGRQ